MKEQEIMYILSPEVTEDEREKENLVIQKYIRQQKGKPLKIAKWGEKRLAYKMKGQATGFYYLLTLEADNECLKNLDTMMKENNMVLNHMIM